MLYSKIYKKISKRIIILENEVNLINKEKHKKEIRRLNILKNYILKKLTTLKNYDEQEIENFILWNI